MKRVFITCIVAIALLVPFGDQALAAMISADFHARTTYIESYGRRAHHSDEWADIGATIAAGAELTNDDLIAYDGWFMQHAQADVDINPQDNTLTINPITVGGIHRFEVWVENVTFDSNASIAGVLMTTSGMIPVTPDIEFTEDSLRITYSSSNYFNFDLGVSDVFQITLVPEPGTMALGALGGLGLLLRRRRRGGLLSRRRGAPAQISL